jgi:hypothetical protein
MTEPVFLAVEDQQTTGRAAPSGTATQPILEEAWAIAIDLDVTPASSFTRN